MFDVKYARRLCAAWLCGAVLGNSGVGQAAAQQPSTTTSRAASPGGATPIEGPRVAVLGCPIYRNAARACWYVESGDKTYYIGRFGVRTRPQLMHQVLIEGIAKEGELSCGATVVEPLRISVLPEISSECNTVLPDNGTGPSEKTLFEMGPEVLSAIGTSQPLPSPPFRDQHRAIEFDFDSTWINVQMQREIEAFAQYAQASHAKRVAVKGRAASVLLTDGRILVERSVVARQRAQAVATALKKLDVPADVLTVEWQEQVAPADGVHDTENRSLWLDLTVGD